MSVTERLMKPGEWSLALREETPYSVRKLLDFFGHVVITPTRIDPRRYSDTAIRTMARYVGIMRRRGRRSIGGIGLLGWLGDPEGKGVSLWESPGGFGANNFSEWMFIVLGYGLVTPEIYPWRVGTVTHIDGSLTYDPYGLTHRAALDVVCEYFGGEYRIDTLATVDAGPASALFETDPQVIVQRKGGSRDLTLDGLLVLELEQDVDVDDYANAVSVYSAGEGGAVTGSTATQSDAYLDLFGYPFELTKFVDKPNLDPTSAPAYAQAELDRVGSTRKAVKLSTDTYDIGSHVVPGDFIHAYDPDAFLFDTTNEVRYRGRVMYPALLRTYATTWPVEVGMGVYYRDATGDYLDLSDWVVHETGGTTLEVGAPLRSLASAFADNSALIERVLR